MVPFSQELDSELILNLQLEHFKNILASENTSPAQIDRFFGHALENSSATNDSRHSERTFHDYSTRNLLPELRESFFNYFLDHASNDEYLYSFLLLKSRGDIQEEPGFVGISRYYEKYGPNLENQSNVRKYLYRIDQYKNLEGSFEDLRWRIAQLGVALFLSFSADFIIFAMTQFFILYASGLYLLMSWVLNLLSIIVVLASSYFLRERYSPTWPWFAILDSQIYRDPIKRENFKKTMTDIRDFILRITGAEKSSKSRKKPALRNEETSPITSSAVEQ